MASNHDRDALGRELSERIQRQVRKSLLGLPDLPEGVVTIVFTDVERSTELVRALGEEAARTLLRRHDELVREVAAAHGGTEVEKSGDGFMLAFRSPRRAVAFGLELRRRLREERTEPTAPPIRVRIGADTGEVIAEDRGYFGTTVFRAARIVDLAGGDQMLVSEATKVLAAEPGVSFVEAGTHELKGFDGSHALFEAVPAGDGLSPARDGG